MPIAAAVEAFKESTPLVDLMLKATDSFSNHSLEIPYCSAPTTKAKLDLGLKFW